MKYVEITTKKLKGFILPALYLAPTFIGVYGFISLVQWTS